MIHKLNIHVTEGGDAVSEVGSLVRKFKRLQDATVGDALRLQTLLDPANSFAV